MASGGGARWAVAIHGGAGLLRREGLPPGRADACRAALSEILGAARAGLAAGAAALEVVVAAVESLEDNPLFNAGRGSVLTAAGTCEMDAALMSGPDRRAGAVAGISGVRHPIRAARAVMEQTPHVLMIGAGAEAVAAEAGLERRPPEWFVTPERAAQLERAKARQQIQLDHGGTVGAVALDAGGRMAAATSTGGMTNKRQGRVGDSPLIGAGTWADATCAVSGTGHGEAFIRLGAAARVSALIELGGLGLGDACARVIREELTAMGSTGGLIAVDAGGGLALPFNSGGMFRGSADASGQFEVAIW